MHHYLEKRKRVSSRFADRLDMEQNITAFLFMFHFTLALVLPYLTLAFLLKLKDLVNTKRTSVLIYENFSLQNNSCTFVTRCVYDGIFRFRFFRTTAGLMPI